MPETSYHIFTADPEGHWEHSGSITATSSDAAIRTYASKVEQDGTYVAVPVRSWTPRKVKVATKASFETTGDQA